MEEDDKEHWLEKHVTSVYSKIIIIFNKFYKERAEKSLYVIKRKKLEPVKPEDGSKVAHYQC